MFDIARKDLDFFFFKEIVINVMLTKETDLIEKIQEFKYLVSTIQSEEESVGRVETNQGWFVPEG